VIRLHLLDGGAPVLMPDEPRSKHFAEAAVSDRLAIHRRTCKDCGDVVTALVGDLCPCGQSQALFCKACRLPIVFMDFDDLTPCEHLVGAVKHWTEA
jgi:hypothetical protein